jgi:glycerate kinase
MRVLIAPDKFKGSLSASQAAAAIRAGVRHNHPDWEIDVLPIADGGEGTAQLLTHALKGRWLHAAVTDALGRPVTAGFGLALVDDRNVALLEMSAASGIALLDKSELDPWRASTFGTGQLILAAMDAGAEKIIIGIGGSATNDGGSGMARALQFEFLDDNDPEPIQIIPSDLMRTSEILYSMELDLPEIIVACDVENPLLGENGATRIYGPQKGVTLDQIDHHEQRLTHLANLVTADLGVDFRNTPGAGAAGGLGFGLLSFCEASLQSGFDLVAKTIHLQEKIAAAELVITGEGGLDAQTLMGKGPAGIARMAKAAGTKVIAFGGYATAELRDSGTFHAIYAIMDKQNITTDDAIQRAGELLTQLVVDVI